jgi:hypothetical protein
MLCSLDASASTVARVSGFGGALEEKLWQDDVFAFGTLLVELVTRDAMVVTPPSWVPKSFTSLIRRCQSVDVTARPTFREIKAELKDVNSTTKLTIGQMLKITKENELKAEEKEKEKEDTAAAAAVAGTAVVAKPKKKLRKKKVLRKKKKSGSKVGSSKVASGTAAGAEGDTAASAAEWKRSNSKGSESGGNGAAEGHLSERSVEDSPQIGHRRKTKRVSAVVETIDELPGASATTAKEVVVGVINDAKEQEKKESTLPKIVQQKPQSFTLRFSKGMEIESESESDENSEEKMGGGDEESSLMSSSSSLSESDEERDGGSGGPCLRCRMEKNPSGCMSFVASGNDDCSTCGHAKDSHAVRIFGF